jgi:hypothetical protein
MQFDMKLVLRKEVTYLCVFALNMTAFVYANLIMFLLEHTSICIQ